MLMAKWAAKAWVVLRSKADLLKSAFLSAGFLLQHGSEDHHYYTFAWDNKLHFSFLSELLVNYMLILQFIIIIISLFINNNIINEN